MFETRSNNVYRLNGDVNPPIVLRSETELVIAQNAHNMIWKKYRNEYDLLENNIKALRKSGDDPTEAKDQFKALIEKAMQEIDALITTEIAAYRAERTDTNACCADRLSWLEDEVKRLRADIDEITSMAEDAQSTAEEAQSTAEDALETAEEALGIINEIKEGGDEEE